MTAEMDRHEVAETLGVSLHTVRALAADPECPLGGGRKNGRTIYWSKKAVDAARRWNKARAKAEKEALTAVASPKPEEKAPKKAKKPGKSAAKTAAKAVKQANETARKPAGKANKPKKKAVAADNEASVAPVAVAVARRAAPAEAAAKKLRLDPISMWLELCKNAATHFEQSCDPRRALLLMNPFAPFAAYASFAAPFFANAAGHNGLGVWGAAHSVVAKPKNKIAACDASEEARRLFACVSELPRSR